MSIPRKTFRSKCYDSVSRKEARELWEILWEYVDGGGVHGMQHHIDTLNRIAKTLRERLPPFITKQEKFGS